MGKTKALGTHVYLAGTKGQHHYTKITEAIANYVGTLFGMNMRMLVKESTDSPPIEPQELLNEDQKSPFKMKLKEKEINQYIKDLASYKLNKEKVYIIILGQCDIALVN